VINLWYNYVIWGNPLLSDVLLQFDLLDWILAVSVVFVVVAAIIGVALLMLIRRGRGKKRGPEPTAPQRPTEEPPRTAEVIPKDPETVIASPPTQEVQIEEPLPVEELQRDKDETSPSLPVIKTVGEPQVLPISGQRPLGITWRIAGLTDVGLKRDLNEDNLIMIEDEMAGLGPYGVYIVADGLGGHVAGEVASQLTIDTIRERYEQNPPTAETASYIEWLKDAAMAANEAVLRHQRENTNNKKMGSTLVMALVVGPPSLDDAQAYVINVGDSRAYLLTNDKIEQISVDHSLVERLVQIGQITREEARTHKQRNVIYSTIGEKQKMEIGAYHVTLAPGDRLLLCSDGLSGMITDEELLKISRHQPDPVKANQMMVEAAKQAGGHDNITAIIIQMGQFGEAN
jgi:protein phosphatase